MDAPKNTTLRGVHDWFYKNLLDIVDLNEGRAITGIVFEQYLGISSTDLILKSDQKLAESEVSCLCDALDKLMDHIPVQHITGLACFRDLVLKVNKHVLIPRPETEELVQWVLELINCLKPDNPTKIWDIGTGSGAIALSLAAECPYAEVWASDISQEALVVANENGLQLSLNVNFFHHDVLQDPPPGEKFDILVSNPPYIRDNEKSMMQRNVTDYEPHSALFVPDDNPLQFYSAIAIVGAKVLKQGGILAVEINEALGLETKNLFEQMGFCNVEIKKDLWDKDRFVKGVWPQE